MFRVQIPPSAPCSFFSVFFSVQAGINIFCSDAGMCQRFSSPLLYRHHELRQDVFSVVL